MVIRWFLGITIVGLVIACIFRSVLHRLATSGAADSQHDPLPPHRWHFLLLVILGTSTLVYGSFMPFEWRHVTVQEAWESYRRLSWFQFSPASHADWGVNLLVMIPIGFCWSAAATLDGRQGWGGQLRSGPFLLLGCGVFSILVEFGQHWFAPRVPSASDVQAQVLGAVIGYALWVGSGQRFIDYSRQLGLRTNAKFLWVLQFYLAGLILYALLPFDVVSSPADIFHKWQRNQIHLLPYWPTSLTSQVWTGILLDILKFVPVGAWSMLVARGVGKDAYVFGFIGGILVAVAMELSQVFLISRHADANDLCMAGLGIVIGCWLYNHFAPAPLSVKVPRQHGSLKWAMLAIFHAGFLCFYYWQPFDFQHQLIDASQLWKRLFSTPTKSLYWSNELTAGTQFLEKIGLWIPLGAMLMEFLIRLRFTETIRLVIGAAAWSIGLLFALTIEVGQLFLPSRYPDLSDVMLYGVGLSFGMWFCSRLHAQPGSRGVIAEGHAER